ncbi:MAG: endonuclease/exonuclease/phosphatase family protein [Turicibacter sp.]
MRYIEKQQEFEKLPVILMGDFNANPNHRLIKGFFEGELNTQQLIAVQEIDRSIYQQATMGGFKDRHHGMHLDYIFVSPEYEVLRTQIVKDNVNGRFPSDHYPLLADVCLI